MSLKLGPIWTDCVDKAGTDGITSTADPANMASAAGEAGAAGMTVAIGVVGLWSWQPRADFQARASLTSSLDAEGPSQGE